MTTTPNTPAELLAMANNQPETPYDRDVVVAAMEALSPDNGGNLGDLQAVAEICLSILKASAKDEMNDDEDPEFAEIMTEVYSDLKIAETFLERAPFIAINND